MTISKVTFEIESLIKRICILFKEVIKSLRFAQAYQARIYNKCSRKME